MEVAAYETLAAMEGHYWWHVGRLRILDEQLENLAQGRRLRVLNVGCGTGGTVGMLQRHGSVVNVDVSDEALAFMARLGHTETTKVDGIRLPFEDCSFDLVAAFDVLEHIDDDVMALREWRRVLRPDGHVLVTVPAHPWLWTDYDKAQHHRRRYTLRTLRSACVDAGLKPRRISYAIAFSLPLVAGYRLLGRLLRRELGGTASYVQVPGWMNRLFIRLLGIEAKLHRRMRIPFGTSLLADLGK